MMLQIDGSLDHGWIMEIVLALAASLLVVAFLFVSTMIDVSRCYEEFFG